MLRWTTNPFPDSRGSDALLNSSKSFREALLLNVIFTDVQATLRALKKAAELADQLDASIRVLVAHQVSYRRPLNRPAVDPAFRGRQFATWFAESPIGTVFDVRLCRDKGECLERALEPHSIVLIGGRQRSWWPTAEKRLAQKLEKHGHQVILVGV